VWIGVKERALRLLDQQPGERQSLRVTPAVGFQQGYECEQSIAAVEDRWRVQARQRVCQGVLGRLQDDE
jgi:hypothetical protein